MFYNSILFTFSVFSFIFVLHIDVLSQYSELLVEADSIVQI